MPYVQVTVGDNEEFRTLCRDLHDNTDGLVEISIGLPPTMRQEDLALFVDAMAANRLVTNLRIVIQRQTVLTEDMGRVLGGVIGGRTTLDILLVISKAEQPCNYDGFWQSCADCKSLLIVSVVAHSEEGIVPSCIVPSCIENFVQQANLADVTFMVSSVEDAHPITSMLEDPHFLVPDRLTLMFSPWTQPEAVVKVRLAEALAVNTSFREVRLLDCFSDEAVASAFGEAIKINKTLKKLSLSGCCEDGLQQLTAAIARNHVLEQVELNRFPFEETRDNRTVAEECRQSVAHTTKLNRLGRRHLKEDPSRPGNASVEEFWAAVLLSNVHDTDAMDVPVLYSWVRDYPNLFVRAACLGPQPRISR